jgi:hypothetical protein
MGRLGMAPDSVTRLTIRLRLGETKAYLPANHPYPGHTNG